LNNKKEFLCGILENTKSTGVWYNSIINTKKIGLLELIYFNYTPHLFAREKTFYSQDKSKMSFG